MLVRRVQTLRNDATHAALSKRLIALAAAHRADGLVVGLPLRRGDKLWQHYNDSAMARRCRSLASTLSVLGAKQGLRVFLVDEAGTSAAAAAQLDMGPGRSRTAQRVEKKVDAMSATLILYQYCNRPREAMYVDPRKVFGPTAAAGGSKQAKKSNVTGADLPAAPADGVEDAL